MHDFLWEAFVTLIVIIDPFATVPVFISLTQNESEDLKAHTAKKCCLIALVLLVAFAFLGDKLLDAMNISEPAFRIAGGFLLLIAAIEMVVAKHSGLRSPNGDETEEAAHRPDISVFPLAIPLIAGPGAITSTVVLMRQAEQISLVAQSAIVLICISVIFLTYVSLRMGTRVMRLLGVTGTNVLTRVFGIILAALAVQHMIVGITAVIRSALDPIS